MPILLHQTLGPFEIDTNSTDYVEIGSRDAGYLAIDINLSTTSVIDVTMVIPDTWNADNHAGTNFAIKSIPDRGRPAIVVEGLYTGTSEQRMPIALQYVGNLQAGAVRIAGFWKTRPSGRARIGSSASASLKVYLWNLAEVTILDADQLGLGDTK